MRPRERLIKHGAQILSNEELLAIFLRVGVKDRNAIELSGDILRKIGGIRALLFSDIKELSEFKGIGTAKWAQLQAVYELVKRALEEQLKTSDVIDSPGVVREFLQTSIGHLRHEVFVCLYLDRANQLIEFQEIFRGTVDKTPVYPKEIAKEALKRNAYSLIIAHNHPSGNPLPSDSDVELTKVVMEMMNLIEVNLLDHCIVTENSFFSFSDAEMLF